MTAIAQINREKDEHKKENAEHGKHYLGVLGMRTSNTNGTERKTP